MAKQIPLYLKGEVVAHTTVDDDLYAMLSQWRWRLEGGYASAHVKLKNTRMHRLILEYGGADLKGWLVDHRDCDRLNNRRENLRRATRLDNARNKKISASNSSGYKGVRRFGRKWEAFYKTEYGQTHIGMFKSAEDAAKAYDMYTRQAFGEFASCNFPSLSADEQARIQRVIDNPKKFEGKSRYVGVSPHRGKWAANTYLDYRKIHIGVFETEEGAARAYNEKVRELFGPDSSRLNIFDS